MQIATTCSTETEGPGKECYHMSSFGVAITTRLERISVSYDGTNALVVLCRRF
jgi:hypothetical protein